MPKAFVVLQFQKVSTEKYIIINALYSQNAGFVILTSLHFTEEDTVHIIILVYLTITITKTKTTRTATQ